MTETNLNKKLLAVQMKLEAIPKDSTNPFYHSKYFDINTLLEVVKPALNEQGLLLTQPLNGNCLDTIIKDTDTNEELRSSVILPDNPDPQKMGAIITYFRRYSLQSLLGLQAEDDDANSAIGNSNSTGYSKPIPKPSAPAKTKEELETEMGNRFNPPATKPNPAPIKYISAGQVKLLTSVLKDKALSPSDLCTAFGITSLERLPATEMPKAIKWRP